MRGSGAEDSESAPKRLVKSERTLQRAKTLRRDMSDEERILWMLLRDRRFADFKFRRQVPLGDFVADFVCFERKLVVALDGSQHAEPEQAAFDSKRTQVLEAAGFRVIRVWTSELFQEREGVFENILNALHNKR
jgi:adenine-specific DNA-methyltransferase